jgi:hypothetical protein
LQAKTCLSLTVAIMQPESLPLCYSDLDDIHCDRARDIWPGGSDRHVRPRLSGFILKALRRCIATIAR